MIKASGNITEAKRKIESFFKKDVEVTVNLGRNKTLSYKGKVSGIYPALFTVAPEDENFKGKTSYSYSEYLCGNVVIKEKI